MERTKSLLESTKDPQPSDLYQAMCKDAAENLDANFVGIWLFHDDLSKITCLHSLDVGTGTISEGQELFQKDFPEYFISILEESMVSASDARTHSQTKCLAEAYLVPNEVYSLLDFIVHKDFMPVGIICCESKGKKRNWSEEDHRYIRSLASFASFKAKI